MTAAMVVAVGMPALPWDAVQVASSTIRASGSFWDVPEGAYFADGAEWLLSEGFTTGFGNDPSRFAPEVVMTRAQMAAFLWRVSGEPEVVSPCGFLDVPPGVYFDAAACWLKDRGITTGYGGDETRFAPQVVIDRGQMAAFLWRWVGEPPVVGTVSGFADVGQAAFYATAARWLKQRGITTGLGGLSQFGPGAPVTRAQMAAFLYRMEQAAPGINEPADEVVIGDEADIEFIVFEPEGTSVFTYSGVEPLVVGSILVVELATGVFYGRVVAIDSTTGHVTTEPAGLAEVIPELDIDVDVDVEPTVVEEIGGMGSAPVFRVGLPRVGTFECSVSNGSKFEFTKDEFETGTFEIKVRSSWRGGVKSMSLLYVPSYDLEFVAAAGGTVTCNASLELLDVTLPPIRFFIGPVPVWIDHSLKLRADGSFTATGLITATATASGQGRFGLQWSSAGGFVAVTDFERDAGVDVEVDAEFFADASVTGTYSVSAYGMVNMDARITPLLDLDVVPSADDCVKLDGAIQAGLTFSHNLPLPKDLQKYQSHTFGPATLLEGTLYERRCRNYWAGSVSVTRTMAPYTSWNGFVHGWQYTTWALSYSATFSTTDMPIDQGYWSHESKMPEFAGTATLTSETIMDPDVYECSPSQLSLAGPPEQEYWGLNLGPDFTSRPEAGAEVALYRIELWLKATTIQSPCGGGRILYGHLLWDWPLIDHSASWYGPCRAGTTTYNNECAILDTVEDDGGTMRVQGTFSTTGMEGLNSVSVTVGYDLYWVD